MKFQKAVKRKQKIRMLLSAPSGSGKTYTALRVATGIARKVGSRIALIDTERGSASLYADKFDFDVLDLDDPTVDNYIKAIEAAQESGYKVLVIDSSSHGWYQILDFVERLTNTKYKGNSFRAWGDGTPLYNKWVNSMLKFDGHIIVTARAKTEYVQEVGNNGKMVVKKVGMGTENRKGLEYEFTVVADGDTDHNWMFSKSRVSELSNKILHEPTEDLGESLYKWLTIDGVEVTVTNPEKLEEIKFLMEVTNSNLEKISAYYNFENLEELEDEKADEIIAGLNQKKEQLNSFDRETWIKLITELAVEKKELLDSLMEEHKIESLEKASDGHLRALLKEMKGASK